MKLWMSLYGMIWIVLLEFLLAMTPQAPNVLVYVHVALGLGIIGLAYYNFDRVRKTAVPGRVKRVAKATLNLSVVMAILGLLLVAGIGGAWVVLFGFTLWDLILFVHVLNAFAIITQAAAVAITYDMWEDKEFAKETKPAWSPSHPPRWPRDPRGSPRDHRHLTSPSTSAGRSETDARDRVSAGPC